MSRLLVLFVLLLFGLFELFPLSIGYRRNELKESFIPFAIACARSFPALDFKAFASSISMNVNDMS